MVAGHREAAREEPHLVAAEVADEGGRDAHLAARLPVTLGRDAPRRGKQREEKVRQKKEEKILRGKRRREKRTEADRPSR